MTDMQLAPKYFQSLKAKLMRAEYSYAAAFILLMLMMPNAGHTASSKQKAPFSYPFSFHVVPANPVLTNDSLFQGAHWNDPSVLKIGRKYVMYASSDQKDAGIAIYRLVSNNGLNWTLNPAKPVFQADPNQAAWDRGSVETPSVVYFMNKYHLFYTGYSGSYTDVLDYKIGHAISADGINWTRDPNYMLAPTAPHANPNLDFNQYVVAEPGAVVFNNKLYVYFSAVGANTDVGTTLQVVGLTTSTDGQHWTSPRSALTPDQSVYPRSAWAGYSTPAAVVLPDGRMHLFFDVFGDKPSKQLRIHHASSGNGVDGWLQDAKPIFSNTDFKWTSNEIRSPSPLLDGSKLHLWFAGDNRSVLGIAHSEAYMPQPNPGVPSKK